MTVLNNWQKISRVLPGQPFGDGKDGAYSSATIPDLLRRACTGTAASTTLTASTTSPFSVGDVVLIHQTRGGANVGKWEINRVSSVGSNEYTLQVAFQYTYTSPAQVMKVPRYTTLEPSGTWATPDWNGTINGLMVVAAKISTTLSSTIEANGANGSAQLLNNATGTTTSGGGFYGGAGRSANNNAQAYCGEGTSGTMALQQTANGNGGGGGLVPVNGHAAGGGGGNALAGTAGYAETGGLGGGTSGSADLTTMTFGGGGGGGSQILEGWIGNGGSSGGAIIIFTKDINTSSGLLSVNGGNGGDGGQDNGAGGGAGGSILVVCQTATLGTNKLTATAGTGGDNAGAGSVGHIAIHHSGAVTGTTNPTFTDTTDGTLIESMGAFIPFL